MAELEPGNADELVRTLGNWPREADRTNWRITSRNGSNRVSLRRFIAAWEGPVLTVVCGIEESIRYG